VSERVLYTIGSSEKSLKHFIGLLSQAGVKHLVDVRLSNTSQLAGFSKKDDLEFLCNAFGVRYVHAPELAPSAELLKSYREGSIDWPTYETDFRSLIEARNAIPQWVERIRPLEGTVCLLCSESTPEHCHRRLVADMLVQGDARIAVKHLV
jgi:uncharacterized protein (DUF488 family)